MPLPEPTRSHRTRCRTDNIRLASQARQGSLAPTEQITGRRSDGSTPGGYSCSRHCRLQPVDGHAEEQTVRALQELQAAVFPVIAEHGGRVINTAGDSILAEFASVVGAVRSAEAIQELVASAMPTSLHRAVWSSASASIRARSSSIVRTSTATGSTSRRGFRRWPSLEGSRSPDGSMRTSQASSTWLGRMPANRS